MMMRMLSIVAVPVVHEQMHQRAGQEEQIRHNSQHMGAVFREQEKTGNREKTIEHPAPPGKMLCFVCFRHGSLFIVQRGAAAARW